MLNIILLFMHDIDINNIIIVVIVLLQSEPPKKKRRRGKVACPVYGDLGSTVT